MLGVTAVSSTVFLIGFEPRLPAPPVALEIDGTKPTLLATEHLSGVAGRKTTIARLQQAVTLPRRDLQVLWQLVPLIRIRVGHAGGSPVGQVSL